MPRRTTRRFATSLRHAWPLLGLGLVWVVVLHLVLVHLIPSVVSPSLWVAVFEGALFVLTVSLGLFILTQRQREREARLAAASEALLRGIDRALADGAPMDVALQAAVDGIRSAVGADIAWIGIRQDDGTVRLAAIAGATRQMASQVEERWDDAPTGQGPTGQAIRSGRTVRFRTSEPALDPWREWFARLGLRHGVTVPILWRGEARGAITAYTRGRPFGAELVERLEALAVRLAVTFELARGEELLRLQAAAMQKTATAIFVADADGRVEWANDALVRLIHRRSVDELIGRPALCDEMTLPITGRSDIWRTVSGGEVWRGELTSRLHDGTEIHVYQTVTPVGGDRDGAPRRYIVVVEDLSDRKAAEATITRLRANDPLTELPNRAAFLDRLNRAVLSDERERETFAVLLVDVDRMGQVNQVHGLSAGDRVLQALARRFADALRIGDFLARLEADTFAVLALDAGRPEEAAALARRLLEAAHAPVIVSGEQAIATVSIGIATVGADRAADAESVLWDAAAALDRAKRDGGAAFQFFSPAMDAEARAYAMLERELREAIAGRQFTLYYQPQLSLQTGRVVGAEALVRWRHPVRGMVAPGVFIPVAERSGLIVPLGHWVLREALRQLMEWRVAALPLRRVAVNVSVPQLRDEGFARSVLAAVREFGMVPSFLDLEITESVFAGQSGPVRETVEKLHAAGLRLALDDFGAGYSSLGYLSRFPVQKLKVDKAFIDDVGSGRVGEAVTRATIELGRALDVAVLAEGVEYEAQLAWLRAQGANEVQGDLIGPPVPPDEFAARFGPLVS